MNFDVTSISTIVAAAGVLIGVVLTVQELRHLVKQRQTDLIVKLSNDVSTNKEFVKAVVDILQAQFNDYDDFVKKYGEPISKNDVAPSFIMLSSFYEQIGVLLKKGLIDIDVIIDLFPVEPIWEKLKPLIEHMRKKYHSPRYYEWFEYLHNEMKKREQRGVKNG